MKLNKLIQQFQNLSDKLEDANFKNSVRKVISLLEQIIDNDLPTEEIEKIETLISPYLENVETHKELKLGLMKLRKSLIREFGFIPSNYYVTLGIGFGLALGTALGISFGVPFKNGIVFGPMIGSGIGLIGGLFVGMYLETKKETENRILKNL